MAVCSKWETEQECEHKETCCCFITGGVEQFVLHERSSEEQISWHEERPLEERLHLQNADQCQEQSVFVGTKSSEKRLENATKHGAVLYASNLQIKLETSCSSDIGNALDLSDSSKLLSSYTEMISPTLQDTSQLFCFSSKNNAPQLQDTLDLPCPTTRKRSYNRAQSSPLLDVACKPEDQLLKQAQKRVYNSLNMLTKHSNTVASGSGYSMLNEKSGVAVDMSYILSCPLVRSRRSRGSEWGRRGGVCERGLLDREIFRKTIKYYLRLTYLERTMICGGSIGSTSI